ncbi:MAG TPA: hypothetical protein VMW56_02785 [Candidatus Margulisiibacteriota bacterium]|nr:hypothetical protein [Candidatus Margulisiibacteriota bacterium]
MVAVTTCVAALLFTAAAAANAQCLGDCNGDGTVGPGELNKVIAIILNCSSAAAGCGAVPGGCTAADKNGDHTIQPGELNNIIFDILNFPPKGCPAASPTPTRTQGIQATSTPTNTFTLAPSATPTPSPTTALGPPLGMRVFSLGSKSAFTSSLLPGGSLGTPMGTLMLDAGGKDGSGRATVTLANPGTLIRTDLSAGNLTLCTKLDSCTGTLYCDGGTDVDVLNSLDSLRADLTCMRDGTHSCPATAPTPPVCCSNACEGVGVGSGNSPQQTSPPPNVTPTPSGAGAMLLICQQRSVPVRPQCQGTGSCCSTVDFSTAAPATQYYTTGIDTAQVLNHCAGSGASPSKVPKIARKGTNFDCANWTTENGVGVLGFTIPAEEGDANITGDGAQAGLWSDQ